MTHNYRLMEFSKEEMAQIEQDLNDTLSTHIALHRWIQRKMPVAEEDISMMAYAVDQVERERERKINITLKGGY